MQKLYQRSMFHLLRVKGQLAPALLAKVTVVEVRKIIAAGAIPSHCMRSPLHPRPCTYLQHSGSEGW